MLANPVNEFLGAKSYPEALAAQNIHVERFPKSSRINGTIGEGYFII
jgi:hypothetical protein